MVTFKRRFRRKVLYYLSNNTSESDHTTNRYARRAILLNSFLLIAVVTTTINKIVEWLVVGGISHAYVIIPTILMSVAIHFYFRKTKNIDVSAYAATITLMAAYVYILQTSVGKTTPFCTGRSQFPSFPFSISKRRKRL